MLAHLVDVDSVGLLPLDLALLLVALDDGLGGLGGGLREERSGWRSQLLGCCCECVGLVRLSRMRSTNGRFFPSGSQKPVYAMWCFHRPRDSPGSCRAVLGPSGRKLCIRGPTVRLSRLVSDCTSTPRLHHGGAGLQALRLRRGREHRQPGTSGGFLSFNLTN